MSAFGDLVMRVRYDVWVDRSNIFNDVHVGVSQLAKRSRLIFSIRLTAECPKPKVTFHICHLLSSQVYHTLDCPNYEQAKNIRCEMITKIYCFM